MDPQGRNYKSILQQVWIGIISSFGVISTGMSLGFSAIALPQLQNSSHPDYLDLNQASWFASISSIATPIGCLICGPLLDRFGRKITLLAITPWFFLGWLILAVSPSPCPIGLLYLGRILTGLATGLASVPAAVYLAEISEHSIRGMLVTFPSVAISLGILIVYVLGMFFNDNWRLVAGISAVLPVSTAILLLFIPESPLWLLSKDRSYDAEKSLRKLRCIKSNIQLPNNVKLEMEVMRINANSNIQFKTDDKVQFDKIGNNLTGGVYYKSSSNGENNTNDCELVMKIQDTSSNPSSDDKYLSTEINIPNQTKNNEIKTCEHEITAKPEPENNSEEYFANCSTIEASPSIIKLPNSEEIRTHSINTNGMAEELKQRLYILLLPQTWKPIFILNSYFFFQQFSGIYVVVFYAVNIVQQAGVVIDAYTATVLLGLVQLIAGIAASFALTRCGRRPMSIWSGVGMTVCMVILAIYLQLLHSYSSIAQQSDSLSWIPLVAMLVYVIAGAIGFHTLPWAMIGELYPAKIKGLAGGLTTCMAYLFNFAALKMYPSLVVHLGGSESGGVFYFYGIVSFIATVFVFMFLPETHNKTLQQIEDEFKSNNYSSFMPGLKKLSCFTTHNI